ncbi:MAG: dTDP-4-dehydrorhamnose 3,5-epimerase family protein [Candidatus Eisenbacteria bacterium]
MNAAEVTLPWLQAQKFEVRPPGQVTIEGVLVRNLTVHLDGRGDVTELWSAPWMQKGFVRAEHAYQSATDFGVVKAWHLHEVHTDQFTVTRGKLQVAMVDLREDSPTFRHVNSVFLGGLAPRLMKIPPRIMHGWKALTEPEVLVVNFQSHIYDVKDEFKFPWDAVVAEVWEPKNG